MFLKLYSPYIDIMGDKYKTAIFGNQLWMLENLRTTNFVNGDILNYLTFNNQRIHKQCCDKLYG